MIVKPCIVFFLHPLQAEGFFEKEKVKKTNSKSFQSKRGVKVTSF
jgi:hypothetical protein